MRRGIRYARVGDGVRLLLVDNDDCFIHTLANYARQTGAQVSTYRSNVALEMIESEKPDIVLISPGPARPADFGVPTLVQELAKRGVPTFGVCLGLQGMVEAFGGTFGRARVSDAWQRFARDSSRPERYARSPFALSRRPLSLALCES